MKITTWILPTQSGRRFRGGHPWVFANELSASPKGLEPGAPVELRDERGMFLARGYGNPHSLIAFRTLSRRAQDYEPWSESFLAARVALAADYRRELGLGSFSQRMVFGEADDLPGLVIDRFVNAALDQQVLVLQVLTAGLERALANPGEWVRSWCEAVTAIGADRTTVVIRCDVGTRKLEGLEIRPPEIIRLGEQAPDLARPFLAWVRAGDGQDGVNFQVDLVRGQKTGFFFDQAANVETLLRLLPQKTSGTFRILDLFCYVGQWGTQAARTMRSRGASPEIHFADASAPALALARANASPFAGTIFAHEIDIVEGLRAIPDCELVICDPPAFIKSKKDHAAGLKGYVKINTAALERVKPGGWYVSCSCSQHLSDDDLEAVLRQAEAKAGRRVRWLVRGTQAPDHPIRLNFPEGRYLKAWIGRVDS